MIKCEQKWVTESMENPLTSVDENRRERVSHGNVAKSSLVLLFLVLTCSPLVFSMELEEERNVDVDEDALAIAKAHFHLGEMLFMGEGCEQNYERACIYLEFASEQSKDVLVEAKACGKLAIMYAFGKGVQKNIPKMHGYLRRIKFIAKALAEAPESTMECGSAVLRLVWLRTLLREMKLDSPDANYGPLFSAVLSSDVALMRSLIEEGALVNDVGSGCLAPLHVASILGLREVAQVLIESGADIELLGGSEKQLTPLIMAVVGNHKELVEFLIARGAQVNKKPGEEHKNEQSPLQSALIICSRSAVEMGALVELLLMHKADPNELLSDGKMLFHDALKLNEKKYIELLLRYGAHVNAVNREGETALHVVSSREKYELLVAYGADVNVLTNDGATVLHSAMRHRSPEFIEYLLTQRFDLNALDKEGMTPLHYVAQRCIAWEEISSLLIAKGANPDLRNKDGKSAKELYLICGIDEDF